MPEPSHFLFPFSSKASLDKGQGNRQVGSLCCRFQPAAPLSATAVELLRSPVLSVHMKEILVCEFECAGMFCLRPCWSSISTCRMPGLLDLLCGFGTMDYVPSLCFSSFVPSCSFPSCLSAKQINTQTALSTALGPANCQGCFEILRGL